MQKKQRKKDNLIRKKSEKEYANSLEYKRIKYLQNIEICASIPPLYLEAITIEKKNKRLESIKYLQVLFKENNHPPSLYQKKIFVCLVIPYLDLLFEMIELNIFRPVPYLKHLDILDFADTGKTLQNIHIVDRIDIQDLYDVLFNLVCSDHISVRVMKAYITPLFIQNLIELMNTKDDYEQEKTKWIFHRIYAKFVPRRKMMRKEIMNTCLSLIHEGKYDIATNSLLHIYAQLIRGFVVPFREQHIYTFKAIFLLLLKVPAYNNIGLSLLRCFMEFITKDHSLAILLIEKLLRCWPIGNSPKELHFITTLFEALNVVNIEDLGSLIPKLFKRLGRNITSYYAQTVIDTLEMFKRDRIKNIINTYEELIYPIIVPILHKMSESCSNSALKGSYEEANRALNDWNQRAYNSALHSPMQIEIPQLILDNRKIDLRNRLDAMWNKIHSTLKEKHDDTFIPPICNRYNIYIQIYIVPFSGESTLPNYNDLYFHIGVNENVFSIQ